jgi:hypothetical protein
MWRVWWKKEDEKSSLLPHLTKASDFLSPMNLCVIKHENGLLSDAKRQVVKILDDFVGIDRFSCGKSFIMRLSVDYTKTIESELLLTGNVPIFSFELPSIRYIAADTYMGFIPIIKVYKALGVLATSRTCRHRVAARVFSLDVFLYVYILHQCG